MLLEPLLKLPRLAKIMFQRIQQKLLAIKELGFFRLLLIPLALAIVLILLACSKFIKVRVHIVQNTRIGHFLYYPAMTHLRIFEEKKSSGNKELNIYAVSNVISANTFLDKMWKRTIPLISGNLGWLIVDLFKRMPNQQVCTLTLGSDRCGLILQHDPCLTFKSREIDRGTRFLKSVGINETQKFVCLHVRDSSYLPSSSYLGWSKGRDWSHHDYRNSEIGTYVLAAETLAEMGYTVFRMGAVVKEPLISKHPRVIDYATNGMRTEFLDVYLGAHCAFCISTGSGWDSIPHVFKVPSTYINILPYFAHDCIIRDLLLYPKIIKNKKTNEILNLNEIINQNIQTSHETQEYFAADVELQNLTSNELITAVTEMAQRVEGIFVETPEQKEMQAKLKHILSTHPKLQPSPNYYPIRAQFASCFLSRYPNFLDGLE